MKVLMISADRGLLTSGSSGDVLTRHQRYADAAGSLDIIVFAGPEHVEKQISANFHVWPTRSNKVTHWQVAYELAKKLITKQRYDLIITQDLAAPVGAHLKKQFSIPWLVSIHNLFFNPKWLGWQPSQWFLYFNIKRNLITADGFRVTNQVIADKLKAWGLKQPILVQSTPVDVAKFQISNEQLQSKKQEPISKVLYVGRLSREKNVDVLVKAFRDLDIQAKLEIVGEGPEEKELKVLAGDDARIQFLGPKNHDELTGVYEDASVLVLPSRTESFGKVLIEAAAAGCILVATKTAGALSIIEDGRNGLLLPINDQAALADALSNLDKEPELREKLAQAAWQTAKLYGCEESANKLVEFWQSLVEKTAERKKHLKVLMLTRKVDRNDALAGFVYNWIKKMAIQMDLKVIALERGDIEGLPDNVEVFSVGKEKGIGRWRKLINALKLGKKLTPEVDVVFVHMHPVYVMVEILWARLKHKPVIFWYTHKHVDLKLRTATFLADRVVSASPESFRLPSHKVRFLGHGIDTEMYKPGGKRDDVFTILTLGRISPAKRIDLFIQALAKLRERKPDFVWQALVVGSPGLKSQEKYLLSLKKQVEDLELGGSIHFIPAVPNLETVRLYQRSHLFVNFSETGSLDKAVLEAAACGCLVLTSNEAFKNILPSKYSVKPDAEEIAKMVIELADKPEDQRLRELVVRDHSLNNLVSKLETQFKDSFNV